MPEQHVEDLATTPPELRSSEPSDMFFAFAGVNLAVTNLAAGALGIALGLSLVDVILVYLIAGAVGATAIGACVVQAKRTGASVLINARPALGYYGTRCMAVLFFLMTACWFGVNNFFGVTAARSIAVEFGAPAGHTTDLVLLFAILALLVGIAIFGYRSVLRYEKLTVVAMGLAVLAVAVGALADGVEWSYTGSLSGTERASAIVVLVTALGIGWAVSWTPYSHDFGRHLKKSGSDRTAFYFGWAGMYAGSFLTFSLSAVIASSAESAFDVGRTVEAALPEGVALIVLLVMSVGLLPANLANLLVGPALLRTMDLRLRRSQAVLATAVTGLPIAVIGVFQPSFGTIFKGWMLTLVVIVAPWLVITLIDFFAIHRGRYRSQDLSSPDEGIGGRFFAPGIAAWCCGVLAGFGTASTPVFTSPIMKNYLANADLSIFVGAFVAGVIYYPWARKAKARALLAGSGAQARSPEVETP